MIDTHAHIYGEYYDDIEKYIEESLLAGVNRIIVSTVDYESCIECIGLSRKYDQVFVTLGVHPDGNADYEWVNEFITNEKVIGVGEIGLDYFYDGYDKEEQIKKFKYMLDLAEKNNLPIVIHSREANEDVINILKEYNLKGIIHSFNGTYENASTFIDMGYLIGVNGIVTFKNAIKHREVINQIDIKNIVLETDAPYLAPHPNRGKINSSKYILLIAGKLAEMKELSIDEVGKITTSNVYRVFDKLS